MRSTTLIDKIPSIRVIDLRHFLHDRAASNDSPPEAGQSGMRVSWPFCRSMFRGLDLDLAGHPHHLVRLANVFVHARHGELMRE
jgi:hypothetical protein